MLTDLSLSDIVIVLVSLLISLGVHEAMHAFTSHRLGDTTAKDEGRLTLNPLKHIDVMTTIGLPLLLMLMRLPPIFIAKPVPFNPLRVRFGDMGAALVALAGPFSNLGLAIVAALSLRFGGSALDVDTAHAIVIFLQVNVGLFVFNMIPFPPLDGSRLLYAFAPDPLRRVMAAIESLGIVAIVLFVLLLIPFAGPVISEINQEILRFLLL
jgi:Zn-dependent protease